MPRLRILFAAASLLAVLAAAPASAQRAADVPQPTGAFLALGDDGALRVVGRPGPSMPLPAAADTTAGPSRWTSTLKGARTGALVGTAIGVGLIGAALVADLNAQGEIFVPWTLVAATVALPIVGTSTLVGGGIGYATGGD